MSTSGSSGDDDTVSSTCAEDEKIKKGDAWTEDVWGKIYAIGERQFSNLHTLSQ